MSGVGPRRDKCCYRLSARINPSSGSSTIISVARGETINVQTATLGVIEARACGVVEAGEGERVIMAIIGYLAKPRICETALMDLLMEFMSQPKISSI